MKRRKAVAVVGLTAVGLMVATGVASAYTAPYNDPSVIGGLTLENASGTPIQGGNIQDDPNFNIAVGTGQANPKTGGVPNSSSTLNICTPNSAVTDPAAWSCDQLSAGSVYNPAGQPSFTWVTQTGLTIAEYITLDASQGSRQTATSGAYQGLYQLRMTTALPGGTATATYYSTTIQVTEQTGTTVTDAQGIKVTPGTWTDLNYVAPAPNLPEAPLAALIPLAALTVGGGVAFARRRKTSSLV